MTPQLKRQIAVGFFILVITALMTACTPYGYVFHHTTRPLSLDMDQTRTTVGDTRPGDIKHFQYNVIDISSGSNGIGDIARRRGLERIYFAEIETLRLLGIWEQEFVHVYGH